MTRTRLWKSSSIQRILWVEYWWSTRSKCSFQLWRQYQYRSQPNSQPLGRLGDFITSFWSYQRWPSLWWKFGIFSAAQASKFFYYHWWLFHGWPETLARILCCALQEIIRSWYLNIISPAYRFGKLTEAGYTIKVHVPEAKRIVFGTTENYQLLLNLKHEDRPAVNLAIEYPRLSFQASWWLQFYGQLYWWQL